MLHVLLNRQTQKGNRAKDSPADRKIGGVFVCAAPRTRKEPRTNQAEKKPLTSCAALFALASICMALADFITFTTYGTWLPGSSKGLGSVDKEHNAFETPFIEPDAVREQASRNAMDQPPYTMSPVERNIVCRSIVQLARDRNWQLLAVHVRTNHVHAVVRADRDPGRVMSDMKARASRDLTIAGFDDAERKRWTRHGSTKHLFRDDDVDDKIGYTLNRPGEPMARFDARDSQEEPRTQ